MQGDDRHEKKGSAKTGLKKGALNAPSEEAVSTNNSKGTTNVEKKARGYGPHERDPTPARGTCNVPSTPPPRHDSPRSARGHASKATTSPNRPDGRREKAQRGTSTSPIPSPPGRTSNGDCGEIVYDSLYPRTDSPFSPARTSDPSGRGRSSQWPRPQPSTSRDRPHNRQEQTARDAGHDARTRNCDGNHNYDNKDMPSTSRDRPHNRQEQTPRDAGHDARIRNYDGNDNYDNNDMPPLVDSANCGQHGMVSTV